MKALKAELHSASIVLASGKPAPGGGASAGGGAQSTGSSAQPLGQPPPVFVTSEREHELPVRSSRASTTLYQAMSNIAAPRPPKLFSQTEDLLNHPEYRLGMRIRTPQVPTLVKFTCPSLSLAVITR